MSRIVLDSPAKQGWMSIDAYGKRNNLSRDYVNKLCLEDKLDYVDSEGGHRKVREKNVNDIALITENALLKKRVEQLEKMILVGFGKEV